MEWMKTLPLKVCASYSQFCEGVHGIHACHPANANINEYMTMVAGGLAGATPHMISATVTAISRLVFEFKGLDMSCLTCTPPANLLVRADTISSQMQTDILTTLLLFLSSSNREIVKSTLGYIKLAIHTLPIDLVRPHLNSLVPALLAWSHDHKNHFKAKVRHIFERMIRRFGWNDVYQAAGEEQASKVLVNIKKRKDRAKRRKAREEDDDDEVVHSFMKCDLYWLLTSFGGAFWEGGDG